MSVGDGRASVTAAVRALGDRPLGQMMGTASERARKDVRSDRRKSI
jgi:chorismate-pyruvate lyase